MLKPILLIIVGAALAATAFGLLSWTIFEKPTFLSVPIVCAPGDREPNSTSISSQGNFVRNRVQIFGSYCAQNVIEE
jgi:hypothetical protein